MHTRRVRSTVVAVLASLSIAISAAAQGPVPSGIAIDNFARVNDSYYRGAQPMGADYAALARLGVKTVINLTSDDAQADEQQLVEKNGMRYVQIPMDPRREPSKAELDKFLALTNDAAGQPVYVHCVGGRHRTGVMTAIYRMTHDGISGEAAFREMKQYKYGADFLHPEFKRFVQSYRVPKTTAAAANGQHQ